MKKMIIMVATLAWLLSFNVAKAEIGVLTPQVFEDQHGQPISLSVTTQWLIFSHNKAGGSWVKQALNDLDITDIEVRGGLYVADTSAMPGIITKLFALPKMKNYDFRIALDNTGELTSDWPKSPDTVTLLRLDGLQITEQLQAMRLEQVKAFLAAF